MQWITIGYWTAVAVAVVLSLLLTGQTFEHRRFARSRSRHPTNEPFRKRVALFVPCKGADTDLEANLRPLFEQDHGNYEIVFVVESHDDPACRTIGRVMDNYPGTPSRLIVAGISTSSGQKVHNLLAATEKLPEHVEALVFVDADVCPPRDWLGRLTARLQTAAVSTGYRAFVPKRPTLANLALSSINGAVVPVMFPGKHHLIWGGSWAITRKVFESSLLRGEWRGTLSDDLIAARVMARVRERVDAEPLCMLPSPLDVDWRGMFSFVRRQLIIGRCYSPIHWYALLLGSSATQALFWGSIVALVGGLAVGANWAWQPGVAVGLLYGLHLLRAHLRHDAARYYLPYRQDDLAAARRFDFWLGPVAGVVGWIALVSSAFTRSIVWKGITYEMWPGGAIRRIVRPAAGGAAGQEPARTAKKAA
jgi:ceramide glucosyltransferase